MISRKIATRDEWEVARTVARAREGVHQARRRARPVGLPIGRPQGVGSGQGSLRDSGFAPRLLRDPRIEGDLSTAWRRWARAPDDSPGLLDSAAATIACRAARCPRNAVRPGLVSVTCRRERQSSRTRDTSTYPAWASAGRCLLGIESEISRARRRSAQTSESIQRSKRLPSRTISSGSPNVLVSSAIP